MGICLMTSHEAFIVMIVVSVAGTKGSVMSFGYAFLLRADIWAVVAIVVMIVAATLCVAENCIASVAIGAVRIVAIHAVTVFASALSSVSICSKHARPLRRNPSSDIR